MRILLLEDEFSLRISIKEFLEDINYEVDDYADGLDAYDAIYSKSYDLLLLDVNVPSMNGFELLQSVRKDNNKTPAIFLTSMTDIENFNEGYKKGCCDYIRKPFELLELELRVKQAILRFYLDDSEQIMISETIFYDMLKGKLMLSGK
ncbi:MAG: response regulator, partial [Sulfurimonas sp.]